MLIVKNNSSEISLLSFSAYSDKASKIHNKKKERTYPHLPKANRQSFPALLLVLKQLNEKYIA